MEPLDYVAFFKRQVHNAALTESIYYITIVKTNKKYSTAYYTSVKNKYHEVSGKITAVNETQENEHYSDVMSID